MSNKVWNWSSINEAFISLEKTDCKYAVLRSYEEIFRGGGHSDYIYCGHDIDLLCLHDDVDKLISALRLVKDAGNIYRMSVGGKLVLVDVMRAGNGEFDPRWEHDMLDHRVDYKTGICHVLSDEDYLYTLIFHSLITKGEFPQRYVEKIRQLALATGIRLKYKPDNSRRVKNYYKALLYRYMKIKGYSTLCISSEVSVLGSLKKHFGEIKSQLNHICHEKERPQQEIEWMMIHIRSSVLLRKCEEFNPNISTLSVSECRKFLNIPEFVYGLYVHSQVTSKEFFEIAQLYIQLTYCQITEETLLRTAVKLIDWKKKYNVND